MTGRASVAASVAALVGFAASGCGSTPLSTTELRSRATRVCVLASKQTDHILSPASPDASAVFLKRGIAVLKPELAELRALKPPREEADVYAVSLTAFSTKLSALVDTVRDLAGGEDPVIAIKLLQEELAPIESQENGAWQALQIPACLNS